MIYSLLGVGLVLRKLSVREGPSPPPSLILQKCVINRQKIISDTFGGNNYCLIVLIALKVFRRSELYLS